MFQRIRVSGEIEQFDLVESRHLNGKTLVARFNKKLLNRTTSEMFYPIKIRGEKCFISPPVTGVISVTTLYKI